jgi:hypothetical protein
MEEKSATFSFKSAGKTHALPLFLQWYFIRVHLLGVLLPYFNKSLALPKNAVNPSRKTTMPRAINLLK